MKKRFVATVAIIVCSMATAQKSSAPSSMTTAQAAVRWIQSTAIKTDTGEVWPADPKDPKSVNTSLYAERRGPFFSSSRAIAITKKTDTSTPQARR